MIPFDRGVRRAGRRGASSSEVLIGAAGRRAGLGRGRTSASARGRSGDRRVPALARRVRDARRAAGGGRGRDGLLEPHPRPGRRRRGGAGGRVPRRAVPVRGRGGAAATGAAASSACRRRTSCPTTPRVPGPRRLRRLGATATRRRSTSGVRPDVRDRPRPARGGLPDRLRRRPLRRDAADRVRGADARREALRVGGRAGRADAARRGGRERAEIPDLLLRFPAR